MNTELATIRCIRLQLTRAGRGMPGTFKRQHLLAVDRATSLARALAEMLR
jgi:hypothetical protein